MHHVTPEMLREAIASQGETFDTHAVQRWMIGRYPVAVAEGILRHRTADHPLRQFSAAFSRAIGAELKDRVRKGAKSESPNLAGREVPNRSWEKLPADTPAA